MAKRVSLKSVLNTTVLVSALGYFVDIYDLLLFGIVRVPSLKALGVPDAQLLSVGLKLINFQMAGMLVGGILWGVLGDKKGRISVLFGSILLYSLANLANAYVTSVEMYAVLRFLAGVGLAGELGAAITLVSEVLPKESRGYGTAIVAGVGITGAVAAAWVGEHYSWQTAYLVGGVLGLALLIARLSIFESGMFESIKKKSVKRGQFFQLFTSRDRFFRYLWSILIGVPVWFMIGILVTFSPELTREMNVDGVVLAGKAIMYCYAGLSLGDFASGIASQYFRTRRKVVMLFLLMSVLVTLVYVFTKGWSVGGFYFLCALIGFASGYWCVFVTMAAENFGTNLRATVTTTVPNFVRGSLVLVTLLFQWIHREIGASLLMSALGVGVICFSLAFWSILSLKETHGKDLDYLES
ncbi:MFS transporter [bacterium]|jgi:MFS family permease|nr:MFS transporter [bacterium]